MKKRIRTFIALSLPNDVAAALGQVSDLLAEQLPPRAVRWVKPELMHVSLRFLGDTAVHLIESLIHSGWAVYTKLNN